MIACEDSVIRTQAQVSTTGQSGIALKRISPAIGVEVSGIDLRQPMTPEQYTELRQALVAHKVLVFRDQNITAAQEKNPFAKISDIVYELLEKAIFSSAIPPGSKLNISKLAEQMGVSTSPVTRAVERLEENGLVTAVRSSDSKYRSYFVL